MVCLHFLTVHAVTVLTSHRMLRYTIELSVSKSGFLVFLVYFFVVFSFLVFLMQIQVSTRFKTLRG